MSAMKLQEIVGEKKMESHELDGESEEGIVRIVEDSLSEGVDLVSEYTPTETIEPGLEEITGEKKVELEESPNGKDDEIEESEEIIVRIVDDSLSQGVHLVSDNSPTAAIQVGTANKLDANDNVQLLNPSSSSGVNFRKRGRELPASILGGVVNVKEGEIPADFIQSVMKSITEKSAKKVDDADDRSDLLETAMKRGVSFPRPSWWPPGYRPNWWPEGYDGEN